MSKFLKTFVREIYYSFKYPHRYHWWVRPFILILFPLYFIVWTIDYIVVGEQDE